MKTLEPILNCWSTSARKPSPVVVENLNHPTNHFVNLANMENQIEISEIPETQFLTKMPTLEQVEHDYIREVLIATGGNKTLAARVLGVDRSTLYRRLKRL